MIAGDTHGPESRSRLSGGAGRERASGGTRRTTSPDPYRPCRRWPRRRARGVGAIPLPETGPRTDEQSASEPQILRVVGPEVLRHRPAPLRIHLGILARVADITQACAALQVAVPRGTLRVGDAAPRGIRNATASTFLLLGVVVYGATAHGATLLRVVTRFSHSLAVVVADTQRVLLGSIRGVDASPRATIVGIPAGLALDASIATSRSGPAIGGIAPDNCNSPGPRRVLDLPLRDAPASPEDDPEQACPPPARQPNRTATALQSRTHDAGMLPAQCGWSKVAVLTPAQTIRLTPAQTTRPRAPPRPTQPGRTATRTIAHAAVELEPYFAALSPLPIDLTRSLRARESLHLRRLFLPLERVRLRPPLGARPHPRLPDSRR